MVDLVTGDVDPGLIGDVRERTKVLVPENRTGRIARGVDHDRLGTRADCRSDFFGAVAEAVLGTNGNELGNPAEEAHVVGIRRIARVGHDDLVTRIKQRAEQQKHRRRGALGHHDVLGVDLDVVVFAVARGEGIPQVRKTE